MDVGTHREINLAFLSLIKIFKDVEVEKKSVTWNQKPELPSSIKAAEVQQVRLCLRCHFSIDSLLKSFVSPVHDSRTHSCPHL